MPASAPESVTPSTVTGLPFATVLLAKVAEVHVMETLSPAAGEGVKPVKDTVAAFVPS